MRQGLWKIIRDRLWIIISAALVIGYGGLDALQSLWPHAWTGVMEFVITRELSWNEEGERGFWTEDLPRDLEGRAVMIHNGSMEYQ